MDKSRDYRSLLSRSWIVGACTMTLLLLYLGIKSTQHLENRAKQGVITENQATLSILTNHLQSEINKIESGVRSLARSPGILKALSEMEQMALINGDSILDRYNEALGSTVAYLLDSQGTCIASSNRNEPDSFIGKNYIFRPYYHQAMEGIPFRYLTLGVTTHLRGLYMSHPVRDGNKRIVGVVVLKKNLEYLEETLGKYRYCFVVSPEGVVFLSSQPSLKFSSLWPIAEKKRRVLHKTQQFGQLQPGGIFSEEIHDTTYLSFKDEKYIVSRMPLDVIGWSIILFSPIDHIQFYRFTGFSLTIALCSLTFLLFFIIYRIHHDKLRLQQSEMLYKTLAEKSFTSIHIMTEGQKCVYVNPEGQLHTGYSEDEWLKMDTDDIIHPEDREYASSMLEKMAEGKRTKPFECRIITREGRIEWVLRNVTSIYFQKKPAYLVHSLVITDRKLKEEKVRHQSNTDQMTGLLNRRGLNVCAEQVVRSSQRSQKGFLLFFIDLDGLKKINDTLGHTYGDKAIIETAAILTEVFRESDVVARIGGDEFIVIAQIEDNENGDGVVERLQWKINQRNSRKDLSFSLSMSVGAIYYDPQKPLSLDDLILKADQVMYRNKQAKQ